MKIDKVLLKVLILLQKTIALLLTSKEGKTTFLWKIIQITQRMENYSNYAMKMRISEGNKN